MSTNLTRSASVRVSDDTLVRLSRRAKAENRKMSDMVRIWIEEKLDESDSPAPTNQEAGQ